MLTSITPLGERGRGNRWGVTVAFHVVGGATGGVLVGALLGWIGGALAWIEPDGRWLVLAAGTMIGIAMDLGRIPLPSVRRQVNEDWLTDYRSWVYGGGFGAQLGLAVVTQIPSAVTWLMLVAAALSGSWLGGAVVVGAFGMARGLAPLTTRHLVTRTSLFEWSGRLARLEAPVQKLVFATYASVVLVAAASVLR